ncbi:hypothetical protein CHARACLAT_015364 [Characodon lateralis]|uniref:Uncharacterized protein n=1 Tax=Characodon lateralis TaxID=208331 RepID=A0ABU7F5J4_9TELE|nr:hypothetical protein [Characodon lateralis]
MSQELLHFRINKKMNECVFLHRLLWFPFVSLKSIIPLPAVSLSSLGFYFCHRLSAHNADGEGGAEAAALSLETNKINTQLDQVFSPSSSHERTENVKLQVEVRQDVEPV